MYHTYNVTFMRYHFLGESYKSKEEVSAKRGEIREINMSHTVTRVRQKFEQRSRERKHERQHGCIKETYAWKCRTGLYSTYPIQVYCSVLGASVVARLPENCDLELSEWSSRSRYYEPVFSFSSHTQLLNLPLHA